MNRVLKSILIFMAAVLILVAGTFLPGLLLDRVMEGKLDSPNYVDTDAIQSYEEDFYDSRQRLLEVRDSLINAEANGNFQIIDYNDSNRTLQRQFNGGYASLLQFIREWDGELLNDFNEWHLVSSTISISNDGYLVGIIDFHNSGKSRSGEVMFDLETGLPLSVNLFLEEDYEKLVDLWRTYFKVFGKYTNMSFNEEPQQGENVSVSDVEVDRPDELDVYSYATNMDGSITLSCFIHGGTLQISLS